MMAKTGQDALSKALLIVKNDALIEAHYRLSLGEQRLVLTLASKIKHDDMVFREFDFKIIEFCELLGLNISSGGNYINLQNTCKKIAERVVKINTGNGWKIFPWLHHVEYLEKEGRIKIQFHEYLAPYLLYVKDNIYTKYKLDQVLHFKSQYSIRVYELLKEVIKEFKSEGEKIIEVKTLREILGIKEKEYSRHFDFKKNVLLQAQKDINKLSDLYFDFEEPKVGGKVKYIKFLINKEKIKLNVAEINEKYQEEMNAPIDELAMNLYTLVYKKYKIELRITKIMGHCHKAILQTYFEILEGEFDKEPYKEKMMKPAYIYGILRKKNEKYKVVD